MLFHLYALPVASGDDPGKACGELVQRYEDDAADGLAPAIPGAGDRTQAIAAAILERLPKLVRFELDWAAVAHSEGTTEAEARDGGWIELGWPEDRLVSITIEPDHAEVSARFAPDEPGAEAMFEEILSALSIVRDWTGWMVYDPQLGRPIDPGAGAGTLAIAYRDRSIGLSRRRWLRRER